MDMLNQTSTPLEQPPSAPADREMKPVTKAPPSFLEPKVKKWRKRIPWLLLGLGITSLTVLSLQPKAIQVELGPVERGNLTVTINAEGKTRVKNQFIVAAPVTGRVSRITKDVGDSVKAGELLSIIDPLPLTTQVKTAQAKLAELKARLSGVETQRPKLPSVWIAQGNIRSAEAAKREIDAKISEAQAQLRQAKLDRDRYQQLFSDGAVPRQQWENQELLVVQHQQSLVVLKAQQTDAITDIQSAQSALKVIESERQDPDYLQQVYRAQIQSVEAELQNLSDEVTRTQIKAPISGKILKIEQESERYVQAGQPLLEIGNPKDLELVIDVLSTDAVSIQPGNLITIEQWGGTEPLIAQVKYVEPEAFTEVSALGVDEQRVNVIGSFLRFNVPLGSEYRVDSKISIWEGEEVLKIPVSALFRCANDWCVFVERGGKAEQQTIIIGHRNENEAEVKQGVKLDEQVILHPNKNILSGTRLQTR